MPFDDPLVSAEWLKAHIDKPDLKIVDATWVPPFLKDRDSGRTCYDKGHIPGAVYFDIDDIADKTSGLSHMLPDQDVFASKVGALGIGDGDTVIAYDSNTFFASARAWWMFRAMGVSKVAVLDGGLKAWQAAGGATETQPPLLQPKAFTATFLKPFLRNMDEMRQHVEKNDAAILDARDQGRFNGTSPEPRAGLPSGHMPGSFCIPASSLITPEGMMKSRAELSELLGTYLNAPVITSCGSGVSAAVIALALARAGNDKAAVYDGSWSEWAAHSDNPIATVS